MIFAIGSLASRVRVAVSRTCLRAHSIFTLRVGVFVIERAAATSAVWNVVGLPQLLSAMSLPQNPAAISTIVWPASIAHVHPHEVLAAATRSTRGSQLAALLAAVSTSHMFALTCSAASCFRGSEVV